MNQTQCQKSPGSTERGWRKNARGLKASCDKTLEPLTWRQAGGNRLRELGRPFEAKDHSEVELDKSVREVLCLNTYMTLDGGA